MHSSKHATPKILTFYKNIKISRELVLTIAYFMLCNIACVLYRFDIYQASGRYFATLEIAKDSTYILLFSYLLFSALSINRILYALTSLALFVSGATASYYLYFFKVKLSSKVLTAIFYAEIQDVTELVSSKLVIWVSFVVTVWYLILRKFAYKRKKLLGQAFSLMCLFVVTYNIYNPQYRILKYYFPFSYLISLSEYISRSVDSQSVFDISSLDYQDGAAKDLVVVLVIGESARFDRFQINGYLKDNNPNLATIKNLRSFKSISCDSTTYTSVPCMLQRSDRLHKKENTLLSIFSKLGFETSWLASQSMLSYLTSLDSKIIYDEVDFALLPGGSLLYPMNTLDQDLLPYLKKILFDKEGKKMIVLHTSGSHWDYEARYTDEFARYKPTCSGLAYKRDPSYCTRQEISNMYDNTILYTDHIISKIIESLKDKNAILFYTSDHGESLGENGVYGHGGQDIPEQMTVPFFVWTSDVFGNYSLEAQRKILTNEAKEINYRYLFHSILDCAGIKSQIIDPALSLCR
jgi:glucan phosphoethanolaminetransferase (alkaline phosphatase superfamily)